MILLQRNKSIEQYNRDKGEPIEDDFVYKVLWFPGGHTNDTHDSIL